MGFASYLEDIRDRISLAQHNLSRYPDTYEQPQTHHKASIQSSLKADHSDRLLRDVRAMQRQYDTLRQQVMPLLELATLPEMNLAQEVQQLQQRCQALEAENRELKQAKIRHEELEDALGKEQNRRRTTEQALNRERQQREKAELKVKQLEDKQFERALAAIPPEQSWQKDRAVERRPRKR